MIKIYSTSWCPSCVKAKRFFEMKGWKYNEINVADKHEDREEVFRVSGQRTVPVIQVSDEIIVGFNKKEIEAAVIK